MTYYEIRKVLAKRGNRIALLFLVGLLVIVLNFMRIDTEWVNEKGESESGFGVISKMREEMKKWSGPLTEERIQQVIIENNRINATPEYQSEDMNQQNSAYSLKQGFNDIVYLLNLSYGEFIFEDWSSYVEDTLSPKMADEFYENRIINLKEWLNDEEGGAELFSDKEKAFLIAEYEKMNIPINYDYQEGWENLFQWASAITMITTVVLGFICAGIFSDEFRLKSNAIFYSSFHGRGKAVRAKIMAGFLIITTVYWGMILLYSAFVLGIYGADGMDCQIQSTMRGWKSFYNITNGQEYIMIMIGGYLGCLFMIALVMLISAMVKSSLLAGMIPFILIFLPSFLSGANTPLLDEILPLFPDRLLQIRVVISLFDLYEIGGKVTGAIPILVAIYLSMTVVIFPVIYQVYKRKQVI